MRRALLSGLRIAALPLLAHVAPALVAPEQRATQIHVEKATRRMTLYRGEDTIGVTRSGSATGRSGTSSARATNARPKAPARSAAAIRTAAST
jgi:hypothetical protein